MFLEDIKAASSLPEVLHYKTLVPQFFQGDNPLKILQT
jgi:hypothetical protein